MTEVATPPPTVFTGDVGEMSSVVPVAEKLTQEYYDATIEKVFRPAWFLLANVNDIPRPGYLAVEVPTFATSVLLTRDREDRVSAFHNFCRHRGRQIVRTEGGFGAGEGSKVTCWFHGWSYGMDGCVKGVPDEGSFEDLRKEELGLTSVTVRVWAGLVFVTFARDPEPLEDWLGDLAEGFDGYYTGMEKIASHSATVRANWNVATDSFAEGYHTVFLHRRTQPNLAGKDNPMRHYPVFDVYPRHVRTGNPANPAYVSPPVEGALYQRGQLLTPAVETDFSSLPPGVNRTRTSPWFFDLVYYFPNIAVLNGSQWVSVVTVWPIDRQTSRVITDHYALKARNAADRLAQAYARSLLLTVTREDLSAMEETQRGLESGAVKYLKLSQQESSLQRRYALVDRLIGDRDADQ